MALTETTRKVADLVLVAANPDGEHKERVNAIVAALELDAAEALTVAVMLLDSTIRGMSEGNEMPAGRIVAHLRQQIGRMDSSGVQTREGETR